MSIRRDISHILNFTIPEGQIASSFQKLDQEGRLNQKHLVKLIVLLLEREEEREKSSDL